MKTDLFRKEAVCHAKRWNIKLFRASIISVNEEDLFVMFF